MKSKKTFYLLFFPLIFLSSFLMFQNFMSDSPSPAPNCVTSEASLRTAVTVNQEVVIRGEVAITGSEPIVIPEGKSLIFREQGSLKMAAGTKLIIKGTLVVPQTHKIFLGEGAANVEFVGMNSEVRPEWWEISNEDATFALTMAFKGRRVILSNKTYMTSKTLTILSGSNITGVPGATIKASKFTSAGITMIDEMGAVYQAFPVLFGGVSTDQVSEPRIWGDGGMLENVQISNLLVDANRAVNQDINTSAILVRGGKNISFHLVKTQGNKSHRSLYSKGAGLFHLEGVSESLLEDCGVDNVEIEGLLLRGSSDIFIHKGEYKNSSSSVIGTQFGERIRIDSVYAHDANNAVISLNSPNSSVTNSKVSGSRTFFGINLGHKTTGSNPKPANDSFVSGNTISNCFRGGVHVANAINAVILKNDIFDCRGAYEERKDLNPTGGISLGFHGDQIIVLNNRIRNAIRGITLRFPGQESIGNSQVIDNVVTQSALSGIEIINAKKNVLIRGNTVSQSNIESHNSRGEILVVDPVEAPSENISIFDNKVGTSTSICNKGLNMDQVRGQSIFLRGNIFAGCTTNISPEGKFQQE